MQPLGLDPAGDGMQAIRFVRELLVLLAAVSSCALLYVSALPVLMPVITVLVFLVWR